VVLGFLFFEEVAMTPECGTTVHPSILKIQSLLRKIDGLRLPARSRRDVERIRVRHAIKELDHALPAHAGHGLRTAKIAASIAHTLALTDEACHDLVLASYLHDVGLLALPGDVIQHARLINAEEYRIVQSHTRLGASILEPFTFLRTASVLIAYHHERWDGSGYPYGIRGPLIPLGARILAIADAFNAIQVPDTADPLAQHLIKLRILRIGSGTQFDPDIVALLCRIAFPSQTTPAQSHLRDADAASLVTFVKSFNGDHE
jgi:HD-GYP domain-containing protein (c-di-GMP phosphodiesterase class II)